MTTDGMTIFQEENKTVVYACTEWFTEELEIYAMRLQIQYEIKRCSSGWAISMSPEDFKQFKLRFDL